MGCEVKGDVPTLACISDVVARAVNALFLFLGAVALGFLLWGSIQFIMSSGDPKAASSARNTITYALLGLVFLLSVFALINFLGNFLGLPQGQLLQFGF